VRTSLGVQSALSLRHNDSLRSGDGGIGVLFSAGPSHSVRTGSLPCVQGQSGRGLQTCAGPPHKWLTHIARAVSPCVGELCESRWLSSRDLLSPLHSTPNQGRYRALKSHGVTAVTGAEPSSIPACVTSQLCWEYRRRGSVLSGTPSSPVDCTSTDATSSPIIRAHVPCGSAGLGPNVFPEHSHFPQAKARRAAHSGVQCMFVGSVINGQSGKGRKKSFCFDAPGIPRFQPLCAVRFEKQFCSQIISKV
jgi:hypothetical protein